MYVANVVLSRENKRAMLSILLLSFALWNVTHDFMSAHFHSSWFNYQVSQMDQNLVLYLV